MALYELKADGAVCRSTSPSHDWKTRQLDFSVGLHLGISLLLKPDLQRSTGLAVDQVAGFMQDCHGIKLGYFNRVPGCCFLRKPALLKTF